MNYIIWNGIDSLSIPGLLISELPPITKPAMRTQITEIDGRDGDISDFIGYSAYDKTLKIGLYGNYDINEIINYFNGVFDGTGNIIFSNEPDKFYNAEITEQIDFERLVRFRTANVEFHTQPFKFLVEEASIEVDISGQTEITVENVGLLPSRPIITIYGTGIIEISVNGYAQFQVDLADGGAPITVDSAIQECYSGTPLILKNRSMVGIFPTFAPGTSTITWYGSLTRIEIQPKSRWL